MKGDLSLTQIEKVTCPFCPDKFKEHSRKESLRHWYKTFNAAVGAQKFIEDLYAEMNRIRVELLAYKDKHGEMSIEDLDKYNVKLQKEFEEQKAKKEEVDKTNAGGA